MNSRILHLAVPSILANITVPLVGMVDIGVSGRLGNVAAIGAIAVGSMLFDLLYWNFGFLRVGTGGLTAQAYGRKDLPGAMRYFVQGEATALLSASFLILIQWLFVEAAFLFIHRLLGGSPGTGPEIFLHQDMGRSGDPLADGVQRMVHRHAEHRLPDGGGHDGQRG